MVPRSRGRRQWERRLASRRSILGFMVFIVLSSSLCISWLGSSPDQFYLATAWDRIVGGGLSTESISAGVVDGSGSLYILKVNTDTLLIKYSSAGVEEWHRNFTVDGAQLVGRPSQPSLAVDDGGGNIYIAGRCFDPATTSTEGFVAGLDRQAVTKWVRTWEPGSGADQVTVKGGAVYAVGYTNKSGGEHAFLVKYDADGNLDWKATWDGNAPARAAGAAVDDGGNIFITGYFNGSSMPSVTVFCGFLVKYDSAGHEVWNTTWSGDYGVQVIAGGGCAYVIDGWPAGLNKFGADNGTLAWRRQLDYLRLWSGDGVDYGEDFIVFAATMFAEDEIVVAGAYHRVEKRSGDETHEYAINVAVLSFGGDWIANVTSTAYPGDLFVESMIVQYNGGLWVVGEVQYDEPDYYRELILMKLVVRSSLLSSTALVFGLASVALIILAAVWIEVWRRRDAATRCKRAGDTLPNGPEAGYLSGLDEQVR